MTAFEQILYFINLFFAAVTAGGLIMVFMAVVPLLRNFSPPMSVQVHQEFDRHVDPYMPLSAATSGIAALVLLILHHNLSGTSAVFTLIGLAGTAGIAVPSELVNKPINRIIRSWSVDSVPADYSRLRKKWDTFHRLRTASGVLALICYIISLLER